MVTKYYPPKALTLLKVRKAAAVGVVKLHFMLCFNLILRFGTKLPKKNETKKFPSAFFCFILRFTCIFPATY